MATYPPPNFIEPLDEFNTSNWITNATAVGFTPDQIAYLNAKYLKFPVAQGLETLQAIIVNGVATFNANILPTDTTNNTSSIIEQDNLSLKIASCANSLTPSSLIQLYATSAGGAVVEQMRITDASTYLYNPVSFSNASLPTSLGTLPPSNTISTQIPTMDWVQQAITTGGGTILTNNNTFTGINDFTNDVSVGGTNFTYTGSLQGATNAGNYVATNQFVQSAIVASQQQSNTYAGLQETLIYSEIPYNYSSIASISGTTLYTYGVSSVSFAVSKSFNTTAYSTNNGVYVNFNPSNPITALGQNTLCNFTPAPQTSFEPCVLVFSADGQYAIATSDSYATSASEVYVMSKSAGNAGTFNAVSGGNFYKFINDACLSADGQYQLLAEISGSDTMYMSVDYGTTFNSVAQQGIWWSCAMSATGKYQMGISQYQYIANSSDYGTTWNYTNFPTNSFLKCCMSANGQYQIAICNDGGSPDSMMMSWDYGTNWTIIDAQVGGTKLWINISITDCGRVAYAFENTGGVYYTLNYGKTWTNATPASFLNGIKNTFSVNGKYLVGQKSGSIPIFTPFSAIF